MDSIIPQGSEFSFIEAENALRAIITPEDKWWKFNAILIKNMNQYLTSLKVVNDQQQKRIQALEANKTGLENHINKLIKENYDLKADLEQKDKVIIDMKNHLIEKTAYQPKDNAQNIAALKQKRKDLKDMKNKIVTKCSLQFKDEKIRELKSLGIDDTLLEQTYAKKMGKKKGSYYKEFIEIVKLELQKQNPFPSDEQSEIRMIAEINKEKNEDIKKQKLQDLYDYKVLKARDPKLARFFLNPTINKINKIEKESLNTMNDETSSFANVVSDMKNFIKSEVSELKNKFIRRENNNNNYNYNNKRQKGSYAPMKGNFTSTPERRRRYEEKEILVNENKSSNCVHWCSYHKWNSDHSSAECKNLNKFKNSSEFSNWLKVRNITPEQLQERRNKNNNMNSPLLPGNRGNNNTRVN